MEMLTKQIGTCLLGLLIMNGVEAKDSIILADQPPPGFGLPTTTASPPPALITNPKFAQMAALSPEEQKKIAEVEKRAYTLDYSGKFKGPDLANTTIKGQLFQNNRPISNFEAKTNADGKFVFDKDYGKDVAIDLYHVAGQEKMKMSCHGIGLPGSKEVKISCTPKNKHYSE